MKNSTPKNVIMQLGALIALYASITSLLILIFSVTNLKFPDEAAYYWEDEGSREAVRNSIAMLIVFFPTFLVFTRLSNKDRRTYNQGEYMTFAKWLIYFSILGGILILLGDLVVLINYFLNGEITSRLLVKVAALFVVVGSALSYYILDIRGYFKKRVKHSMYFGLGGSILVIVALVCGYSHIETPEEVRQMRFDEQQVTDLQDMYWKINQYYTTNEKLPTNLTEAYTQSDVPDAPDNRADYKYSVIDEKSVELCATFTSSSPDNGRFASKPLPLSSEDASFAQNQDWEHTAGEVCFIRTFQKFAE